MLHENIQSLRQRSKDCEIINKIIIHPLTNIVSMEPANDAPPVGARGNSATNAFELSTSNA